MLENKWNSVYTKNINNGLSTLSIYLSIYIYMYIYIYIYIYIYN